MAVDTRDKRASALAVAVATFALVLPNPDGAALNQGDRQQTAYSYRGIAAAAAIPLTASACDTLAVPEDPPTFVLVAESPTLTVPDEDPTFVLEGCA